MSISCLALTCPSFQRNSERELALTASLSSSSATQFPGAGMLSTAPGDKHVLNRIKVKLMNEISEIMLVHHLCNGRYGTKPHYVVILALL